MASKKNKTSGIDRIWDECERKLEEKRVARLSFFLLVYRTAFSICVLCYCFVLFVPFSLDTANLMDRCLLSLPPMIVGYFLSREIKKTKLMIKLF